MSGGFANVNKWLICPKKSPHEQKHFTRTYLTVFIKHSYYGINIPNHYYLLYYDLYCLVNRREAKLKNSV